jgi:hypothetical protein
VFCFPGGNETVHEAIDSAILFCVTNEPLLAFENLRAPSQGKSRSETVHWPHDEIEKHLGEIYERPENFGDIWCVNPIFNPSDRS